jgi:hypothetical protein
VATQTKSTKQVTKTRASVAAGGSVAKPVVLRSFSPWLVVGFFALLTLVFYNDLLFGGKFLWEDFVEQEFPFRTLATTSLAQGILPQWDPYVFAGMPFMADIQVAFWYPFNMLQALFVSDGYLSPVVMQWFIILHYMIAGVGMFWFAKKIFALDDWSSVFAGVAYAFSGYIIAQAMHQMIVYHIALFPLVCYFFIRGFSEWKSAIVGGILLGVMYLAGHPQSTLYFTFFLALLAVYEIVYRMRQKEALNAASILRMALPVIIGFGIFAIQYLPSQELADLSRRETITYQKSLEGSLTWGHVLTFVMPRLFGVTNGAADAKVPYWNGAYYLSWETAIYIGILPLFFAIMAGLVARKQKYVPFFVGMAIFALLFALGDHFFVYKIFFSLPLFSKFRTPARMMMVFSFAASALAGVGLSNALKAERERFGGNAGLAVRGLIALPWLLAIIGSFHAASFLNGAPAEADASISWAAGLATLPVLAMLAITLLHYLGKLRGNALAAATIIFTVIELCTYGMSLNASPTDPREAFRQQPELIDMLKKDESKELSRARTRVGNQMIVKRNQGAYDRIQLVEGYDPLVLQRVFPEMLNPEQSADLMNIKYSIMTSGQQSGFGMRPTYMPRVKLYYNAKVLPDAQALSFLKSDSTFHYRDSILLEEQPSAPLGPQGQTSDVKVTQYSGNEIVATANTDANTMLFFSEIYYPEWNAYLDGKPVKLYRAFTTLRAVEVPKGQHTITLRYESKAFAQGSMITIVTLVLSLGGLGAVTALGRRKKVE